MCINEWKTCLLWLIFYQNMKIHDKNAYSTIQKFGISKTIIFKKLLLLFSKIHMSDTLIFKHTVSGSVYCSICSPLKAVGLGLLLFFWHLHVFLFDIATWFVYCRYSVHYEFWNVFSVFFMCALVCTNVLVIWTSHH